MRLGFVVVEGDSFHLAEDAASQGGSLPPGTRRTQKLVFHPLSMPKPNHRKLQITLQSEDWMEQVVTHWDRHSHSHELYSFITLNSLGTLYTTQQFGGKYYRLS